MRPGDERITLIPPKGAGQQQHRLARSVWTDKGHSAYYDKEKLDWMNLKGSWVEIETLVYFDNKNQARDFMIARSKDNE